MPMLPRRSFYAVLILASMTLPSASMTLPFALAPAPADVKATQIRS